MLFNFTTVGKYVSLEEALNTYSRLPITSCFAVTVLLQNLMSAGDTYILLPGIEYTETVNVGIVVSLFEGRLSPFQHGVINVSSKKALLGPHSSRVISFDLFMVNVLNVDSIF